MDAQGPGSPYQQTLQQEPRTNGATPTPRTISTSFHLSSRTIATPPPTTHPPHHARTHLHTHTPHPLHFTFSWSPTPPTSTSTSSSSATPSHQGHGTHTFTWTHTHLHTRRRFPPRSLSLSTAAQSRQPPGMGEYYERGLIGRSL